MHFQFAPWLVSNPDGRAHVDHCADQMEGFTVAAEFRHRSWFSEAAAAGTLQIERSRHLVNVIVDEPQGSGNIVPAVWEVTNDGLAIVRLHGRNHETWNVKDAKAASDRFNYDYSDEELAELAEKIRIIASQVSRTHVIFNNNYVYTVMLSSVRWLALDAQLRRGPASGGLAPYVGRSSTRFRPPTGNDEYLNAADQRTLASSM